MALVSRISTPGHYRCGGGIDAPALNRSPPMLTTTRLVLPRADLLQHARKCRVMNSYTRQWSLFCSKRAAAPTSYTLRVRSQEPQQPAAARAVAHRQVRLRCRPQWVDRRMRLVMGGAPAWRFETVTLNQA